MKNLKVFQNGQMIADLNLETGKEYIIGRSSSADIKLPEARAISRNHLKLSDSSGSWTVELTSKFENLFVDGESVTSVNIEEIHNFSVPPFEFSFEEVMDEISEVEPVEDIELQANEDNPEQDQPELQEVSNGTGNGTGNGNGNGVDDNYTPIAPNHDHTQFGKIPLVPYLRILNTDNNLEDVFKLEGSSWIIGRHASSEVQIDDPAVSRRHFEIGRGENGFVVRDLGSSNGLLLNGSPLIPKQPSNIESGDLLEVRHLKISFELRDPAFDQRVKDIAPITSLHDLEVESLSNHGEGLSPIGPAVLRVDQEQEADNKSQIKKYALFAAPAIIALAFVFGDGSSTETKDLPSKEKAPPSAEILAEAKDLFELAKNHYQNGKYEFCLTQVQRLHQLVPFYETSKDIENLCKQGLELERINADRERKERERKENERKIVSIVEGCEDKIESFNSLEDAETCLADAIELSPEHPKVIEILSTISSKEQLEAEKQRRAAARSQRRNAGLRKYQAAKSTQDSGDFRNAIKKYQLFLRGNYGLSSEEASAKQAIAEMNTKIGALAKTAVDECNSLLSSEKYKEAILTCEKALKIDPKNKEAEALQSRGLASLKRTMKSMYEDSILEESLGNLDAAKEKWRQILEQSVPSDSYYNKAKSKLKKYGLEI